MPTDKDYEELYNDYMFWAIDYDEYDPPDYRKAADILLSFIQRHCSHPCVYFDYQLDSLTHFIKVAHKNPVNLTAFRYIVEKLMLSAEKGQLPDTRILSN